MANRGEWRIAIVDRTLNLSTVNPFDYGEIEDRYIFSYISMLRLILEEIEEHNAKSPNDPWLPPQHMWVRLPPSDQVIQNNIASLVLTVRAPTVLSQSQPVRYAGL